MSSKLLSTLLASGALLAAAQVAADDAPAAPAAKPSNAWTDMRPLNAAAPPTSSASPAVAPKGSAAMAGGTVTGTGTVTGPVSLAATAPKKKMQKAKAAPVPKDRSMAHSTGILAATPPIKTADPAPSSK